MSGYRTPEDAVRAGDSVPPQYANIVAVEHSPSGEHAVVFIAYNEPPHIEPYVVLCEKTPGGWVEGQGGSGGGMSWMTTTEDGSLGVHTTWDPRTARWNVPAPEAPKPEPGAGKW
jgi:hypothetical protein